MRCAVSRTPFEFDQKKATETILYLSSKLRNADKIGICKLLYFVDKTSLEKYGRFVFGDEYCAMASGPVPSHAYDLMKAAATEERPFRVEGYRIIPQREPNMDWLSESDVECLDQIIHIYEDVPNWKRVQDSHDDSWKTAWDKRGEKRSAPMSLESIIEMFEDSHDLKEYVFNRDA